MTLEGKSELFKMLAPPDACPECGDQYPECGCPLADNYAPCPKCAGTGWRRDWRGTKVRCDDCWSDNGPE